MNYNRALSTLTSNGVKKYLIGALLLCVIFAVTGNTVQAQTLPEITEDLAYDSGYAVDPSGGSRFFGDPEAREEAAQVHALQRHLFADRNSSVKAFLNSIDPVSDLSNQANIEAYIGFFGTKTTNALKVFQRAHIADIRLMDGCASLSLTRRPRVDSGITGPCTRAYLNSIRSAGTLTVTVLDGGTQQPRSQFTVGNNVFVRSNAEGVSGTIGNAFIQLVGVTNTQTDGGLLPILQVQVNGGNLGFNYATDSLAPGTYRAKVGLCRSATAPCTRESAFVGSISSEIVLAVRAVVNPAAPTIVVTASPTSLTNIDRNKFKWNFRGTYNGRAATNADLAACIIQIFAGTKTRADLNPTVAAQTPGYMGAVGVNNCDGDLGATVPTSPFYNGTRLQAGQTYTWFIDAADEAAIGYDSPLTTFTLSDTTTVPVPTIVSFGESNRVLPDGVSGDITVTLAWEGRNVSTYRLKLTCSSAVTITSDSDLCQGVSLGAASAGTGGYSFTFRTVGSARTTDGITAQLTPYTAAGTPGTPSLIQIGTPNRVARDMHFTSIGTTPWRVGAPYQFTAEYNLPPFGQMNPEGCTLFARVYLYKGSTRLGVLTSPGGCRVSTMPVGQVTWGVSTGVSPLLPTIYDNVNGLQSAEPTTIQPGTDYKLRLVVLITTGSGRTLQYLDTGEYADSQTFEILPATSSSGAAQITVTSVSSEGVWPVGSSQTVNWRADNLLAGGTFSIRAQPATSGSATTLPSCTGLPATARSCTFLVPSTLNGTYSVLMLYSVPGQTPLTDSGFVTNFTVTPAPTVTTYPNRLSATVTASASAANYPAANAGDSNENTSWVANLTPTSANNNAWIQLDFGSVKNVTKLHWLAASGTPYPAHGPTHYSIASSNDGVTWDIFKLSPQGYNTAVQGINPLHTPIINADIPFPTNIYGRYLKLNVEQVNDGTGWSLSMKEFWAEGSDASVSSPIVTLSTPGLNADGSSIITVQKSATGSVTQTIQLRATTNTADARSVTFARGQAGVLSGVTVTGPTPNTVNASASVPGATALTITVAPTAATGDIELQAAVVFTNQAPANRKIATLRVVAAPVVSSAPTLTLSVPNNKTSWTYAELLTENGVKVLPVIVTGSNLGSAAKYLHADINGYGDFDQAEYVNHFTASTLSRTVNVPINAIRLSSGVGTISIVMQVRNGSTIATIKEAAPLTITFTAPPVGNQSGLPMDTLFFAKASSGVNGDTFVSGATMALEFMYGFNGPTPAGLTCTLANPAGTPTPTLVSGTNNTWAVGRLTTGTTNSTYIYTLTCNATGYARTVRTHTLTITPAPAPDVVYTLRPLGEPSSSKKVIAGTDAGAVSLVMGVQQNDGALINLRCQMKKADGTVIWSPTGNASTNITQYLPASVAAQTRVTLKMSCIADGYNQAPREGFVSYDVFPAFSISPTLSATSVRPGDTLTITLNRTPPANTSYVELWLDSTDVLPNAYVTGSTYAWVIPATLTGSHVIRFLNAETRAVLAAELPFTVAAAVISTAPTITLTSPTAAQSIDRSRTHPVRYTTTATPASNYRLKFYWDATDPASLAPTDVTGSLDIIPSEYPATNGVHTFTLELVDASHRLLNPRVRASVQVNLTAAASVFRKTWQPSAPGWGPPYCDNKNTRDPFIGPAICPEGPQAQDLTGRDCTDHAIANSAKLLPVKTAYDTGHNFSCVNSPQASAGVSQQLATLTAALQALLKSFAPLTP